MYRVGFGDFFLVTLRGTDGTAKHILVDCGVHAANLGSIGEAIKQLAADTGGKLALVIMTHRHADHISGFAIGKDDFAQFEVESVWMPWFEDPKDSSATNFQANLTAAATQLQLQLAARNDPADEQLRNMAENITGDLSAAGGGGNDVALATLNGGFKNPVTPTYYKAGDPAKLPDSLVHLGLTAQILGPPDDLALIAQMDNAKYQYLAGDTNDTAPPQRFNVVFESKDPERDYPSEAFELFSLDDIKKRVASAQPDVLAAKAAKADNTINNQSLVVLFTFNGKTMLFAGDAQWGNWDKFLFDGAVVGDSTPLTAASKLILGKLDFYKVGHHGSRNASPIPAVTNMRPGVVAMCSTQPGAYGKSEDTLVPQGKLMKALDQQTQHHLARSDQVGLPPDVPPRPAKWPDNPTPLDPVFTKNDAKGYIDYEM